MIDSIVTIIDRSIELLDRHSKSNRQLFEDHIEPLFSDLLSIQADYRGIFADLEALFDRPRNDEARSLDSKMIETLRDRRRELEQIREKSRALAAVLQLQTQFPEVAQLFFRSVYRYFKIPSEDRVFPERGKTALTSLAHGLEIIADEAKYSFPLGTRSDESIRRVVRHVSETLDSGMESCARTLC